MLLRKKNNETMNRTKGKMLRLKENSTHLTTENTFLGIFRKLLTGNVLKINKCIVNKAQKLD